MRLQQTLTQIFRKPYLLIAIQLVFFLLISSNSYAQGWERTYPVPGYENLRTEYLTLTQDGGYCLTATISNPSNQDIAVLKLDAEGNQQWINIFGGELDDSSVRIFQLDDGGYIIGGNTDNNTLGYSDWYILRIDEYGNKIWDETYGSSGDDDFNALVPTPDNGFLLNGEGYVSGGIRRILLRKIDSVGVQEWINTVGPSVGCTEARDVKPTSDGGYILVGAHQALGCSSSNDKNYIILKVDENGQELWSHKHGGLYGESGEDVIETQDGGFVTTGYKYWNEYNADMHLVKVNAVGDTLWTRTFGVEDRIERGFTVTESPNGDLISIGNTVNSISTEGFGYVVRTDSNGNLIEEKILTEYSAIGFPSLILPTPDEGYIIAGTGDSTIALIKTDEHLNSLTIAVKGNVFYDIDYDCMVDSEEKKLENWIVVADGEGSNDYFSMTDSLGNYEILCDTGAFILKVISPNELWEMCSNVDPYNLTLNDFFDTISVDFPMQAEDYCPHMSVEISAPQLRRCFENTYYVEYCNDGTLDEANTVVEILFDSFLLVTSSSLPYTDLGDNLYSFDIGNVAVGECGNFTVNVMVDCDSTVLGQTHCVEAHIYPDSLCIIDSLVWDGSNMEVEALCLGDSVLFSVTNTGVNPPDVPNVVRIVEDDLVFLIQIHIVDLNPGETETLAIFAGDGGTFRIEVDQTSGHPTSGTTSASIEGCGVDIGNANLGYVTQFPMDDGNHYIDIDCQENVGSYDPNDKVAYPKGYFDENFIGTTDELEYHIRFQNTGTDTAFTVVLRDTLSEYLDPTTLRLGVSSHDYSAELLGNGILKFTFDNILLPDSTTNLIESNGFIKFTIQQKNGNLPGTVINNSAGIYFDFNEPIITPIVFHTIENKTNYIVEEIGICEGDSFMSVEILSDTVIIDTFPEIDKQDIIITSIELLKHSYSDSILIINNGDLVDGKPIYGDTVIIIQNVASNGCDSLQRVEITVSNENPLGYDPKFKISPNPTADFFYINYNLKENSSVTLVLYDILGKRIRTLLENEIQPSGAKSFKINREGISGNVIFVHWQSGDKNFIQKVIITP